MLPNDLPILPEDQKMQLLNISRHIAEARNKEDLFHLIAEELRHFISFDNAVISVLNEESTSFGIFLAHADAAVAATPFYDQLMHMRFPLEEGSVPYKVARSETPIIVDIGQERLAHPGLKHVQISWQLGMREQIATRLVHSGRVIGSLVLISRSVGTYGARDIATLQALSNLFAIALKNILSNQEIALREEQNKKLLKMSAHIASVREKQDLFRLIAGEMKAFIEFDDVVIALVDMEKMCYSVFLSDVTGTTSQHRDYPRVNNRMFPIIEGGPAWRVFSSDQPILLDLEAEHHRYPEIDALRFAYNFGMREEIIVQLSYSGKQIGLMGVLSKKKHVYTRKDMDTVYSLSSMVAIALNNILANDELALREQQQLQLLNISANIATVRDRNDLFHLIAKDARAFIPFDSAVVSVVNETSTEFSVFLSDFDKELSENRDFNEAIRQTFPIAKGSIPYRVIHSEKPIIFDIKMEHFKAPDIVYLRHAYNFGMREELVTRLTHSGKIIGAFVLMSRETGRFSEKDIVMLQSLSSLISIALNNILTNAELESLSRQLEQDYVYLNEEIKSNHNFEEIIGESQPLQEVFRKVVQVAHADSTVLILGETGTGKELIARAIHNLSSRKGRPLIKVNCAALPAQLIESELFGHEKGSFTGATDKRIGKFELAHGSSIFLDEIGELPLELQAKLLRVLQEKEIERVGGEKSIKVDVRIIAATNRNLGAEVAAGKFRSDLYYRLNIYPIELPALRDRRDDIPLLAGFFLRKLSNKLGKKISSISPAVMEELVANDWPGNVRELEHTIERSMLLTTGKTIVELNLLRPVGGAGAGVAGLAGGAGGLGGSSGASGSPSGVFEPRKLSDNERELILETLKYTKGRIRGAGGAAELLDILPTTLEARIRKLGIKKEFMV